jgi:stage V sporulation protein R
MKVWENIEKRWNNPTAEDIEEYGPRKKSAGEKLFEVREVERDVSFLRRYLTEELIRELNLFEYKNRGNDQVVSRVADEENWRDIKETLLQNVGTATIPVIKVEDSDYGNNRTLLLRHYHDGRDLQLDYAERTLKYVNQLWGRDVALDTVLDGRQTQLVFADGKFALKKAA